MHGERQYYLPNLDGVVAAAKAVQSHLEYYQYYCVMSGYLPISGSPDSRSPSKYQWSILLFARNGPVSFLLLAVALVTGLLCGYMLTSPAHKTELCTFPFDFSGAPTNHVYPDTSTLPNTIQPHQSAEGSLLVSDDLDLEALRSIVTSTRGCYARDYSMGLGWNNVGRSTVQHVSAFTHL